MNQIILEKRKALQALSHSVQELAEHEGIEPSKYKVNDLLMMFIYNPDNEFTFNSFVGWKNEGYTVKKGTRAFLLWGQPINRTRTQPDGTIKEPSEEDEQEPPFFPLAMLFRSDQVVKPIRQPKQDKPIKTPEIKEPVYDLDL